MITNAAARASNVVGLVYVAAFAPDEGESLADIESDSKDSGQHCSGNFCTGVFELASGVLY